MKSLRNVLVGVLFSLNSFAAETPKTFTGEALKVKNHLESLFTSSKEVNSADPAKKASARKQIQEAMDWERIAKDCLGNADWAKNAGKNRQEYQALLEDVIVKTAYTRLDTFWDGATYEFTKMDPKGNNFHATAVYTVKGDSFTLDYFLNKKNGKWLIYDVAFEDIRYSENIREQIRAFLKEKGFPNLLAKLKERRDKLDAEAKAPKKG